jgi:hypothetical protein
MRTAKSRKSLYLESRGIDLRVIAGDALIYFFYRSFLIRSIEFFLTDVDQ